MEQWQRRDNPAIKIEAVRVNEDNIAEIAHWSGARMVTEIDPEDPQETQDGMNIVTPNGMKRASLGMYVSKFGKHFFVSHVRPFEEVYEPVNRPSPPPESIGDARKARGFADPFDGRRI